MRGKRRNHLPSFKAKVAVAALKGDLTMSELSEKIDAHPNQITEWRMILLNNADQAFGGEGKSDNAEHKMKDFHAKTGQLTMERDFLETALERIHGPKGKGW
jgi:transposase